MRFNTRSKSIYDKFVAAFIKQAEEWTVGDPRKPGVRLGPVVSQQHFTKVKGMLDRAHEKGFVAFGHNSSHGLAFRKFIVETLMTFRF